MVFVTSSRPLYCPLHTCSPSTRFLCPPTATLRNNAIYVLVLFDVSMHWRSASYIVLSFMERLPLLPFEESQESPYFCFL